MIEYKVQVFDDRTEWFLNGKYHREDGPALEYANGDKYWYKNGKFHREDGPACEYASGSKYWYLEGKEFTEKEFLQRKKPCVGKKVTVDGVDYELVQGYRAKFRPINPFKNPFKKVKEKSNKLEKD